MQDIQEKPEQLQEDTKIPHLKVNAILDIKIGSAFVNRLQQSLEYVITDHKDELKQLEDKKGDYKNITPWENAVITHITLLQDIMRTAENSDQIEFKSLKESIESVIKG